MSAPRRGHARRGGHEEEHEEHENHERWLVSYADMMTLLMVLFIVMFAISSINQGKFNQLKEGLHHGFGAPQTMLAGGLDILDSGGAVETSGEPLRIEQVSPDKAGVLRHGRLVPLGEVIEDRHLVPRLHQLQGDDDANVARSAGDEELQLEITTGPSPVRIKVSSAFAPVIEGFQAKAWPTCISCSVSGDAITSRAA